MFKNNKPLLPVTVLSGFLGAGKTTLLKKILREAGNNGEAPAVAPAAAPAEPPAKKRKVVKKGSSKKSVAVAKPVKKAGDMRVAVIVNDMASVNIDANEVKNTKLLQNEVQMVELHNGCICCTLRGDLIESVSELAKEGKYDYLVVESTGISEPMPVAQTFTHESLSGVARLDTLVSVVDAQNIFSVLTSLDSLADEKERTAGVLGLPAFVAKDEKDKSQQEEEEEENSIAQLMLDQIEFASVLILSKAHLVSEEDRKQIVSLLSRLNPVAKLVVPSEPFYGDMSISEVIDTKLFSMERAHSAAGWIQLLAKEPLPEFVPVDPKDPNGPRKQVEREGAKANSRTETEEYGVSSVVFRASDRPFHPQRLMDIMNDGFGSYASTAQRTKANAEDEEESAFAGVVRAKGLLWVASGHAVPGDLHIAGKFAELHDFPEPWLAALPKEYWQEEQHETHEELKKRGQWTELWGDRRTEAVFIGVHLNKERIQARLCEALLTDEELAAGPDAWKEMEDPIFEGKGWELILDQDEEDEEDEEGEEAEEAECGHSHAHTYSHKFGGGCPADKKKWI